MPSTATIILRTTHLLSGVNDSVISKIAATGRLRTLKGRFGRIDSDELSKRLFLVLSGEMRMIRVAPDGQEHLLQRFKEGEFFCLAAAASQRSCPNQMISAKTTELMYWNHNTFRQLADGSSNFFGNVLDQMAEQIEREREMRTLSSCCKADVKVAAFLLHKLKLSSSLCISNCSIDLKPISLTAQELGIARETLSRCLKRLVLRDGITYQSGIVQVTDISSLETVLDEAECGCSC